MSKITQCKSGNHVETWYDRHTRSWVTQTLDADRNQIGEADYSGCRENRDFCHDRRVKAEGGKAPERVSANEIFAKMKIDLKARTWTAEDEARIAKKRAEEEPKGDVIDESRAGIGDDE